MPGPQERSQPAGTTGEKRRRGKKERKRREKDKGREEEREGGREKERGGEGKMEYKSKSDLSLSHSPVEQHSSHTFGHLNG